jgi:hypothetical protein
VQWTVDLSTRWKMSNLTPVPSVHLSTRWRMSRCDHQVDDVYLISAARTPLGCMDGGLRSVAAHRLGSIAIQAAVARAGVQPGAVEEVLVLVPST